MSLFDDDDQADDADAVEADLIREGIARGWWDVDRAGISDRARRKSWWAAATARPTLDDPTSWKRKPWWIRESTWDFAYALADIEVIEYLPERRAELTRRAVAGASG
ncbi:hypothetical protein HNP11_004160 [Tsukamurella ocularis]|uniref:hypothetical protein n=1 Tax=Tsukamurella ocularis TaxID=1970234 RepID=UPI00216806A8|nr:hypothetical protein [Tsukamurella ocularis]MCS3789962.1 hypothetical protein [Tsukamurella ocularis]